MSQFPFPQQPVQHSQGQPQPYGQPAYPAPDPWGQPAPQPQQYAPAPQAPQYAPQQPYGYGQQPPAPQQYQGPPPVAGTLDAFNSQPIGGGGPALSWDKAPIGTTVTGTVARDVQDADVQQDTDFRTKAPKFYRDGRPMLVMVVPAVLSEASQRHPDGRASVYIKSGLREAWAAGMSAAGISGPPKAGDQFQITLTGQKDTGQGNPKNIFGVQYHRPGAEAPAPVTQPEVQAAPQQVANHVLQEQARATAYSTEAPQPSPDSNHYPEQPHGFTTAVTAPQAPAQPQGLPAGMTLTPEQAELLSRLQQGGQS